MSFDWYRWAKTRKNLNPPEKAVLVCIADYYNDKDKCEWPSQNTLSEDTSYSRATINRACKGLKEKGLLTWSKKMLPSGHFSSNTYQLHRVSESRKADSVVVENETAVSHSDTSPCRIELQKLLTEPLDLTLNNNNKTKKSLSKSQRELANLLAKKYYKKYRHEGFYFDMLLEQLEKYLLTDQTEESWKQIRNGLDSPKELGFLE